MPPARLRTLAACCFFVTGATSLIYQVVWSRLLSLSFGSAHYSVAAVVAAYMIGLGAGAWLLGGRADRLANPARVYALLELAIAAYGAASPALLAGIERVWLALDRAIDPSPVATTFLKLVLSLLALATPTALMGGTLPVLARALVTREGVPVALDVGRLYAINTLGAVVGTLLAGFFLIEHAGLHGSLLIGATLNAAAGIAILRARPGPPPTPPLKDPIPVRELLSGTPARFALCAAFVAGFASLADEVVWTRVLALLTGSSTYAFTIILSSFLLGIGLGAGRAARAVPGPPALAVARAQLLAAGGALLLLVLFEPATRLVVIAAQNPLLGWKSLLAVRAVVAVLAVVPATIGFGATFSGLVALAARNPAEAGARVGLLYAANTAGAILGSLLSGFVLLHYFSSYAVLRAAVIGSLAVAAGAIHLGRRDPAARPGARWRPALLLIVLASLVGALPPWPVHLLDLGAPIYLRGQLNTPALLETHIQRGRNQVVFFREGPLATVTVRDAGHARYLRVNGKSDASTSRDMTTQLFSAILPLMAHSAPRRTLVIGAGSGVTARAAVEAPGVEAVDLVEIEPAVIEAGSFFEDVNHAVYRSPRLRIHIEDGRNFLLANQVPYDVIISEPTNPWTGGSANLFTAEYYRLVARSLAPGGVFCQWIQRYGMTGRTLRRLYATPTQAFPHVQLWRTLGSDTLLLASPSPIRFRRARAQSVLAALEAAAPGEALLHLGIEDVEDLASLHLFGRAGLAALAGGAPGFRDDPPELEFAAFRDLYAAPEWLGYTTSLLRRVKSQTADAVPEFDPPLSASAATYALGRGRLLLGDVEGAESLLARASQLGPTPRRLRWLGECRLARGDAAGAERAFLDALSAGGDPRAAARLGDLALARQDLEAARARLAMAAGSPRDPETAAFGARLSVRVGDYPAAAAALERVLELDTADALGRLASHESDWEYLVRHGDRAALGVLRSLAERRPRFLELRALAGRLAAKTGRCSEAADDLGWLRRINASSPDLLELEARCLASLGRDAEAHAVSREAARFEPWRLDGLATAGAIGTMP